MKRMVFLLIALATVAGILPTEGRAPGPQLQALTASEP
jgi:hypothetical protein